MKKDDLDYSKDFYPKEANFVRRLKSSSNNYKRELHFKCFNCGNIGHIVTKWNLRLAT